MYLLSRLTEEYLCSAENFNKRRNALYLSGWIDDLTESGFQCQSMQDFRNNFDVMQASITFESIINQLDLLKKYGESEINEDFLFKIMIDEYRNGCYDSACDFLYYKKYAADRLNFPFTVQYNGSYRIGNMSEAESEKTASDFLAANGIICTELSC